MDRCSCGLPWCSRSCRGILPSPGLEVGAGYELGGVSEVPDRIVSDRGTFSDAAVTARSEPAAPGEYCDFSVHSRRNGHDRRPNLTVA